MVIPDHFKIQERRQPIKTYYKKSKYVKIRTKTKKMQRQKQSMYFSSGIDYGVWKEVIALSAPSQVPDIKGVSEYIQSNLGTKRFEVQEEKGEEKG